MTMELMLHCHLTLLYFVCFLISLVQYIFMVEMAPIACFHSWDLFMYCSF
jgi:hypothetical protein